MSRRRSEHATSTVWSSSRGACSSYDTAAQLAAARTPDCAPVIISAPADHIALYGAHPTAHTLSVSEAQPPSTMTPSNNMFASNFSIQHASATLIECSRRVLQTEVAPERRGCSFRGRRRLRFRHAEMALSKRLGDSEERHAE